MDLHREDSKDIKAPTKIRNDKKNKLGTSLLIYFLGISLIPLSVISSINYFKAYNSLFRERANSLTAISKLKLDQFKDYLIEASRDLSVQANISSNVDFLTELRIAYETFGEDAKDFVLNPVWTMLTQQYSLNLIKFQATYGYQDIYLIDSDGNILFTIEGKTDLGTNILTGDYSNTSFAQACRDALDTNHSVFSDLSFYTPSNIVSGFIVQTMRNGDGKSIGLMAILISIHQIDKIMQKESGLGIKGETYLIGSDCKMRCNSVLSHEPTALIDPVQTDITRLWKKEHIDSDESNQVENPTGEKVLIYTGREGKKVLGIHHNITVPELSIPAMAVIAEINVDEAFAAINEQRSIAITLGFITALFVVIIAFLIKGRIVRPIEELSAVTQYIAQGDFEHDVHVSCSNEIGILADRFRDVVSFFREITKTCDAISQGNFEKTVNVRGEKDRLGIAINGMLNNLKASTEDSRRKINYLNNIPTPVIVIDKNYNIQFVNTAAIKLYKIPVDRCLNKKCFELFTNPHCNTSKCRVSQAMQQGKTFSAETVFSLLNGETIPVRYYGAPLMDNANNVTGAIEYIIDITDEANVVEMAEKISEGNYSIELKPRSEEDRLSIALNRMTEKLRNVMSENENQNWLKTGQMKLNDRIRGELDISELSKNVITSLCRYLNAPIGAIYINEMDNTLKLTGSYAFSKRKSVSGIYVWGEGLVGQAALEKEILSFTNIPGDYIRIQSGLGESPPKNIVAVPFLYNNEVKGVLELGTFQEFTDLEIAFLKQVGGNIAIAVASAESRIRLQDLLEQTQQQAEELQVQQEELRQSNEELESQTKALKISEARLKAQQEELTQINEELQSQQEELRQANEELEEKTEALEKQQDSIRIKNEELLLAQKEIQRKADDLELTSKYKSEFLANMSHELRTPLNSLLILSKLLSENKENNLNSKQIEFAETIYSSGNDLLDLINEILDLSKIESGKMEFHFESVILADLVQSLKKTFMPIAFQKKLEFIVDMESGLPEKIETDWQRLEQVVKNLLSNAFKFTEQGRIILRCRRPRAGEISRKDILIPSQTVTIEVTDSGIGIPKDKQRMIFEAFQQADGTTSRKYGGTGLGLSISRELIKSLGGEMKVDSDKGKGATFSLYLPETQSPNNETNDPPEIQTPSAPETVETEMEVSDDETIKSDKRPIEIPDDRKEIKAGDRSILIIEDDHNFAKILTDLSREKGFKCLVADNGETGLQFAEYYKPSAIILDIGLPGIDGWQVMERLKDNADTRHIPVHFISGMDYSADAMRMGAIGYLTKPVSIKALNDAFDKIETIVSKSIKNLLLVEDDEKLAVSIRELIGSGDVIVSTANRGEAALERMKADSIDCIILDLGLPDMTGLDLIEKIKHDEKLSHIPIIVYTARDLTSKEKSTLHQYAESVIIKDAKSPERLLDETTLFLHRVEANLPEDKQRMIRTLHDKEAILRGKKLLIADDDMRNVFALTSVLEEKGIEVSVAKNGKEATQAVRDEPAIDLVLMDIMMPEMDGYEAIKHIRQNERSAKLPIIALTAKAMKGDRIKCIEAGASDYLAKPIDTDRLLSMLRVWLYR